MPKDSAARHPTVAVPVAVGDGDPPRITAGERAADQMVQLIEQARLRPGDKLPAEATLTRRFGLNRLAVREAIRILTARGILVSSQGRPARVSVPGAQVFGQLLGFRLRQQSLGFTDLADARRAIEGAIARRAAARVGRGEVSTHRADLLLVEMGAALPDGARFNALDVAFHRELASLAGNETLQLFLDSLSGVLLEARSASYAGRMRRGQGHSRTMSEHRALLDAILAGDSELAETTMDAHLLASVEDLRADRESVPHQIR